MAIIDLNTGISAVDINDPSRKRRVINLDTGAITDQSPAPAQPVESMQDRALRLGAIPGVGLTPDQVRAIDLGQQITPDNPMLTEPAYMPRPAPEGGAFSEAYGQGLLNIGSGILKGYGELAKIAGDEEAKKFLFDLAASQSMEMHDTDILTEGHPVKRFGGEVLGETTAFPFGSAGKSLLARLLTSMFSGGAAGGLSATGRGEEGTDVALEAGLGAGFGLAGEGATAAVRARNVARQADRAGGVEKSQEAISEAADQIDQAQNAQANLNTRLLPAQQSLNPFLLEKQAFLGQHAEVSRKAFDVLKQQNREAAQDVANLLNLIAAPEATGTAGRRAQRTAGNIIDAAVEARREAASPLYKKAFAAGADVDLTDTLDVIEGIASTLPEKGSKIKGAVLRVKNLLKGRDVKAADGSTYTRSPTLKQLHGAKLEIDEMLNARGDSAVGNTTRRYLTQIQKELVGAMRTASPEYANAMDEFKRLSPAVTDLRDGVLGRIADIPDKDLKRTSSILFDASETNPEVLRNALRALKGVEGGDEVARSLLRVELEKRLGRMRVDVNDIAQTGGRSLQNAPQVLLNNLFGNAAQRRVFLTALSELSPDAARNAVWLEDVLSRAASGRPGGSQTGIRNVIAQEIRGVGLALRDFFKKPIDTLAGLGEDAAYSRRVEAIGDALYNPDWKPDMDKIRKLNPNSAEAKSQFEMLLDAILDQNMRIGASTQSIATAGRKSLEDEN